jgi:membrane-associated phospholipid phosphatase
MTAKPRMAHVGGDLIRAQLLAEAFAVGIKQIGRRDRPEGRGFSFPSGHTTVSFASATVLQRHFGWRIGLPAYATAGYIAVSRVQMRRHYLSDVAFGAALGILAGRTVTFGHAGPRLELAPQATPYGAALSLRWTGAK